jgi:hypothetical protein
MLRWGHTRDINKTRAVLRAGRLSAEIPAAWLSAIRDAVRPGQLATLLGSAVLAALIGGVSSYVTAEKTISGQLRLEIQKTKFQVDQERAKEQIKAYQVLSNKLFDLRDAYLAYLIFVAAAQQHGMNADDRKSLLSQANTVGQLEREVITARRDFNIGDVELLKRVDGCVSEVADGIRSDELTPVVTNRELPERLQLLAKQAQDDADQTRKKLSRAAGVDD